MRSSVAAASGTRSAARLVAAVSLALIALAGCRTVEETGAHVAGWTLVDANQRHPILVSQQPATLSIRVTGGAQGPSSAQVAQVSDFLARYRAMDSGNSKLVIAVPSGLPNEGAAMRAVAHMRQLIQEYGFGEHRRHAGLQRRRDATAPIRLAYLRYVAQGPRMRPLAHQPWRMTRALCPTRISAAHSSTIWPRRSPTPPTCWARAPWRRRMPIGARSSWTGIARARRPGPRRAAMSACRSKAINGESP